MASKDSVRYLASSVMGLADRLRQGRIDQETQKRQEEMLNMQKEGMALNKEKMNSAEFQNKRQSLIQVLDAMAGNMAEGSKGKISKADAWKTVYSELPDDEKKYLPELQSMFPRTISFPEKPNLQNRLSSQSSRLGDMFGNEASTGVSGIPLRAGLEGLNYMMNPGQPSFDFKKVLGNVPLYPGVNMNLGNRF
jgi:hypothetical protein